MLRPAPSVYRIGNYSDVFQRTLLIDTAQKGASHGIVNRFR